MSGSISDKSTPRLLNVPNQLTIARLVLSAVLFALIGMEYYLAALAVFIVAAGTDWVDGYWARKYGQVTQLGRILDPFADKIIICGAFIYLVAVPQSQIRAWMAVVVIGRELLVTALRSFIEERGGDFSAKMSGKLKMVVQCLAVGFSLYLLSFLQPHSTTEWASAPPPWLLSATIGLVWASVAITVYSGAEYIVAALRILR